MLRSMSEVIVRVGVLLGGDMIGRVGLTGRALFKFAPLLGHLAATASAGTAAAAR
jgi:hypothetical protein